MSEKLKRPSIRVFLIALFLGFGTWWGIVALSAGANVNILPGVEWDFERTGQLGDSFGILSALMGSLAAFFTFQALMDERDANRKLLAREEARDRDAAQAATEASLREAERDRTASLDLGEARLFRMLELRLAIMDNIAYRSFRGGIDRGREAISVYFNELKHSCGDPPEPEEITKRLAANHKHLGHYFRFSYHILLDIREGPLNEDGYRYSRIFRAQLSEEELALLAINCAYGEGREKFADIAAHFTFFHNLSKETIERFRLRDHLEMSSFDRPTPSVAPVIPIVP